MNICPHCQGEFCLNVVASHYGSKFLRAGCCNSPLRPCPKPDELMRSASLTSDERNYLQRVSQLDWFGGQVAAVLLQIEAKVQVSGEVAA